MFNINFDKLINYNLEVWQRTAKRLNRLKVAVYEVKFLYDEYIVFRDDVLETVFHNGQVMSLEKILNEKFPNTTTNVIFISDPVSSAFYIFKKAEAQPPVYIFKKFNGAHTYAVGEYCLWIDNVVYQCAISTNQSPTFAPGKWVSTVIVPSFLYKKVESFYPFDFIVNVPFATIFDQNAMKALINKYKQAGKKYTIVTY